MTIGVGDEMTNPPGLSGTQEERQRRRIAQLYASDAQFQAANPVAGVIEAVQRPGLRLATVLQMLAEGYADRPALGQRMREEVRDPVTGRSTTRLLPSFETITCAELWAQVQAVAAAWHQDQTFPVKAGEFVASVGFAGPEYLIIDLVSAYLGLVSVPLQHSAPASVLRPIIDETEPRVLATGAAYLDLAVESALQSPSLRHLVVFDYHPES